MRLEWFAEDAIVVRDLEATPFKLAEALSQSPVEGVLEMCPSYETLGLIVDPWALDLDALRERLAIAPDHVRPPARHRIPVCYELGEDLPSVAEGLGLSVETVAELHRSTVYTCWAIGFCPGFPYLGYLPQALQGVPRRASPRPLVEPGTVAITGRQTCIYPLPRPGGWSLIGKTPLTLVDLASGYFPISAGDEVVFEPVNLARYEALRGERL